MAVLHLTHLSFSRVGDSSTSGCDRQRCLSCFLFSSSGLLALPLQMVVLEATTVQALSSIPVYQLKRQVKKRKQSQCGRPKKEQIRGSSGLQVLFWGTGMTFRFKEEGKGVKGIGIIVWSGSKCGPAHHCLSSGLGELSKEALVRRRGKLALRRCHSAPRCHHTPPLPGVVCQARCCWFWNSWSLTTVSHLLGSGQDIVKC